MTASPDMGELPVVSSSEKDDGPLIPSPTQPGAWFVSLVPPKDSLPLDFDPLASGAPGVSAETPPDVPAELSFDVSAETPSAPDTQVAPTTILDRFRATWSQGLPTPLIVVLVAVVLVPGVMLDVARDGSFGLPSTVLFLLAAVTTPLLLRPRSLPVGVVLPPLAFAATATAIAWQSGLNATTREIGLDVGTTMALQAPVLFVGTGTAVVVVVGRYVVRLVRR